MNSKYTIYYRNYDDKVLQSYDTDSFLKFVWHFITVLGTYDVVDVSVRE